MIRLQRLVAAGGAGVARVDAAGRAGEHRVDHHAGAGRAGPRSRRAARPTTSWPGTNGIDTSAGEVEAGPPGQRAQVGAADAGQRGCEAAPSRGARSPARRWSPAAAGRRTRRAGRAPGRRSPCRRRDAGRERYISSASIIARSPAGLSGRGRSTRELRPVDDVPAQPRGRAGTARTSGRTATGLPTASQQRQVGVAVGIAVRRRAGRCRWRPPTSASRRPGTRRPAARRPGSRCTGRARRRPARPPRCGRTAAPAAGSAAGSRR